MAQTSLLVSLLTTGLVACGSYHENYRFSDGSQDTQRFTNLTFESVRSTVLQPHCFRCHSAAMGNRGGINLETYANVLPLLSRIQARVQTDQMPFGGPPLAPDEKHFLFAWIHEGAPQGLSND